MRFFIIILFALLSGIPSILYAQEIDSDNDGLSDSQEALYYTDLNNPDTDGDSFLDGIEVGHGYSPHKTSGMRMHQSDYDNDGLNDWLEIWFHGDLGKSDTDGDGMNDFDEVMKGYSVTSSSTSTQFARSVEVDLSRQRLNYFVDNVKILNIPVSTGNPGTETPVGEFSILSMVASKAYVGTGYNLQNVQWNMEFKKGGYYIHGTYWHNDFGIRTHSHGCVNLSTSNAELLYKYMDIGVPVRIIGETPKKRVVGI